MEIPARRHAAGRSRSARRALLAALAGIALAAATALPRRARAQSPEAPPAAGPLLDQLRAVGRALDDSRANAHQSGCVSRCFVLEHLQLTGSAAQGRLAFELRGAVLANGPVAVPLFGPADQVRVADVLENDRPATVGFEDGHYYVFTAARRFTVRGALALASERALTIVGPVNAVDAELSEGRVVEGAQLSGVENLTAHLESPGGEGGSDSPPASTAAPAVMQIARALRVRRTVEFEYRLTLRGSDALGVFHLPLGAGEQVLDVQGATGWRVAGDELVLPTTGTTAAIVVTGTLRGTGVFAPDPRSTTEWWLLESDPEHRLEVETQARRFDLSQSPIPSTQPAARLYLLARGQHLAVRAEALVAQDALVTVVPSHVRTLVWARAGELVSDDQITYDNSGTDYLRFAPAGRAVFLGEDGQPQRLMRDPSEAGALLLPLHTGRHTLHVQSLRGVSRGTFFGRLALPMSRHPLNATQAELDLGLPLDVHPVALLGGEQAWWFLHGADGLALALAALLAAVLFRGRARRVVGALVLGGLWFASHAAFATVGVLSLAGVTAWLVSRLAPAGRVRLLARVAAPALVLLAALYAAPRLQRWGMPDEGWLLASNEEDRLSDLRAFVQRSAERGTRERMDQAVAQRGVFGALGGAGEANASPGWELTEGVTPVQLPLPMPDRVLHIRARMVTPSAPFRPVLIYATDAVLWAAGALWLLAAALLLALHRRALAVFVARARARLERERPARERHAPEPEPQAPAPADE